MNPSGIALVVGLGNPGARYAATRHNAGFWFVEHLAAAHDEPWRCEPKFHGWLARLSLPGGEIRLLKPDTFMNHSGRAVAAVAHYFGFAAERILIAHDELDLPVGRVRLKCGGGHAGHNGLRDTVAALGSAAFWRLRIGIGHPGDKHLVTPYVLSPAPAAEVAVIEEALVAAAQYVPALVNGEWQRVMSQLGAWRPTPRAAAAAHG